MTIHLVRGKELWPAQIEAIERDYEVVIHGQPRQSDDHTELGVQPDQSPSNGIASGKSSIHIGKNHHDRVPHRKQRRPVYGRKRAVPVPGQGEGTAFKNVMANAFELGHDVDTLLDYMQTKKVKHLPFSVRAQIIKNIRKHKGADK